jgi:hypothetical protein
MKNKSVASFRKSGSSSEDETVSLGALAEITGETSRQIQRLVAIGEIPRPAKRGEYNLTESVRGIVHYYRERASKFSEARIEAATRREKAEAEIAELTLAEKYGEITDWMKRRTIDTLVRVRRTLEQAEYIPMESRIRLSHDLANMPPPGRNESSQEYGKRPKRRRSEIR